MNILVPAAVRRTLALTILVMLLALAWTAVVRPLIGLSAQRHTDIVDLSARLAHLEAIIARRPELQRRRQAGKAQFAAADGLWHGASASVIGAAVQDRLGKAVAASGGRVDSSSEAHETVEHGFHKITVHFSIDGTLATITKTLTALETTRPALFADRVTISAADTAGASNSPPVLHLDLDVSGYFGEPRS